MALPEALRKGKSCQVTMSALAAALGAAAKVARRTGRTLTAVYQRSIQNWEIGHRMPLEQN
jgi:hypothetical protein